MKTEYMYYKPHKNSRTIYKVTEDKTLYIKNKDIGKWYKCPTKFGDATNDKTAIILTEEEAFIELL